MPVFEHDSEQSIPRLMILRGAPGIGKSTISKSVCKINSAAKKTWISVDAIQHLDLRSPSKNKEKLGIKNAALLTASFLEEGFDVVLDYVFDDIDDIRATVQTVTDYLGSKTNVFIQKFYLDAPIEKVQKRNQSRSGKSGEYMNTALLKKLYAKTSATKGLVENETVIDTSLLSAKQTARTIVSCKNGVLNGAVRDDLILPEADLARALETDE